MFTNEFKEFFAYVCLNIKLKGGLNQITCLFRFCLVFWDGFSNFSVVWYPLFLSVVLYLILALLNSVSSQDKFEMRLLVIDGNCLIIEVGWLDFECMYSGVLISWKESTEKYCIPVAIVYRLWPHITTYSYMWLYIYIYTSVRWKRDKGIFDSKTIASEGLFRVACYVQLCLWDYL